jgi:hypothetical protein
MTIASMPSLQKPTPSDLRRKQKSGATRIPITQILYETDPSLLAELLARDRPDQPEMCGVTENYLTDLKLAHQSQVQVDLLESMLPHIFGAWQQALLSDRCRDAASELVSAFFAKPSLVLDLLGPAYQSNVQMFGATSILYAVSSGKQPSIDLRWVPYWVGQCACWSGMVSAVWDVMAQSLVPGHARAVLGYLARLAYSDQENPMLLEGVVPAEPWAPASFDSAVHWRAPALADLESRLEWSAVTKCLDDIARRLGGEERDEEALLVAEDIRERRHDVFVRRRSILLSNLGRPGLDKFWDDEFGAM